MRKSRGRRFDDEPKLNMKKVVATLLAFLVLVMVVASKSIDVSFYSLYGICLITRIWE